MNLNVRTAFCLVLVCVLQCVNATAAASPSSWPDTYLSRLQALALLQTLNAELLSHDSATLTLEHWCDAHRLAFPARIVAVRMTDIDKVATLELRRDLGVSATEPLRYRRVKLVCGVEVLSEADNWYVPSRLPAAMNRLLDSSDTPFGKVVQSLHFQRHTLAATLLWRPLPEGWEMNLADRHDEAAAASGTRILDVPAHLLEHRAVLSLRDGTPFSEVVETYTDRVVALPVEQPGPSKNR